MGFCSYCGGTTEGHLAACEGCRTRNASARRVMPQRQNHSPIETFLFSGKGLAIWSIGIVALAAVMFGPGMTQRGSFGATPTPPEVEPLVRDYLTNRGENCTVSLLSDISVGEFDTLTGGWPVYVSHKTTCRQGSTSITYDGSRYAERRVAATFVRRGLTGSLQAFKPEIIGQFEQEIQREFDKLSQDIRSGG